MTTPDQSFPKSVRLTRQSEFDRVHNSRFFAADNTLVVKAVVNGMPVSRLGLSVSRKVGNAVVRNRWKRRIREAFRRQRQHLPIGLDFVVRPRKGGRLDSVEIETSLQKLVVNAYQRIRKSAANKR